MGSNLVNVKVHEWRSYRHCRLVSSSRQWHTSVSPCPGLGFSHSFSGFLPSTGVCVCFFLLFWAGPSWKDFFNQIIYWGKLEMLWLPRSPGTHSGITVWTPWGFRWTHTQTHTKWTHTYPYQPKATIRGWEGNENGDENRFRKSWLAAH